MTMVVALAPPAGLKARMRRVGRRSQVRLVLLAAPLILYTLFGFIIPLAFMLERSLDNTLLATQLPRIASVLGNWSDGAVPETAYGALIADLHDIDARGKTALVGKTLNYEYEGYRGLLVATAQHLGVGSAVATPAALLHIDARWGEIAYWQVLRRATRPYTLRNLLAAVDLKQLPDGEIARAGPEARIHLAILARTILISAAVCGICLLLALPIALVLSSVSSGLRSLLLVFVMLPFWTPVLVRTTAWIVLLQNEGVINQALVALHLAEAPLPLMYSRTGVLVAMTHVLLPYMVLPIYAAMRGVSISHVRASLSLGAAPLTTIRRVYLPLISSGIRSGCVLVFVLALGYYITPALVGGPSDQMFSYLIAFHTSTSLNWGMASALSLVLLACVGLLFFAAVKILGPVTVSLESGR